MKKILLLTVLAVVFTLSSCSAGAGKVIVKKGDKISPDRSSIITFSAYDKSKSKVVETGDPILETYQAIVTKELSNMFGYKIVPADVITKTVDKLGYKSGLNSAYQAVMKVNQGSTKMPKKVVEMLAKIAETLKVDLIAFPIVSAGYDRLKNGTKIKLTVIVYDAKEGKLYFHAALPGVKISALEKKLDGDKLKAACVKTLTSGTNKMIKKIKKCVKVNKK